MKKTIGILAHVDAGKTTLSEQILYRARAIRQAGRVDHGDAFLDSDPLEKERGITIFSDQAFFEYGGDEYYWIDTPGHVDFSPEMERAISVMDYAVVVVSAAEGVQSHTLAIWRLLEEYHVPTLLFVNKLDRAGADFDRTVAEMKKRLSIDIVGAGSLTDPSLWEEAAGRDEELLEMYLSGQCGEDAVLSALREQTARREIFCAFPGCALRGEGVDEFLRALHALTRVDRDETAPFSARVYKIRHTDQGERLCFFKVLSGCVCPREEIALPGGGRAKLGELRRYHGAKFRPLARAAAGDDAACLGLDGAYPGDVIGEGARAGRALHTEPMMAAAVLTPPEVPLREALSVLKRLEDEEPTLKIEYDSRLKGIEARVMGRVQLEVLRDLAERRYHLPIQFGPMRVLYMETVASPVLGIGHYEPLRHYAEVHLRLRPGERGSGIRFVSLCHVDDLSLNWQRLIETHVFEKEHRGVLTGAPLTDVVVELVSGRAHLKHTEGGDFREATYRAIRNALMYAQSVLLEPVCRFTLRAPSESFGRVMGDMAQRHARTEPPEMDGDQFSLTGEAPFARFAEYPADFLAVTHGLGSISVRFDHYEPCENAAEVIEAASYDPLAGDDPPHSVFCAHGGGYLVPWDQVRTHAHIEPEE